MEIRWLEDFIALAKTRHFSRAADEQNVTQPTFSRRIKLLEEEMKVTLIDRNTLPLSLTPAGEVFLQSAELITRQIRDTKEKCQEIKKLEESRISFVTTQTLFLSFYKDALEPFCQSIDVSMDVNMKSSSWIGVDFINSLKDKQSDLMLCFWHPAIDFLRELDDNQYDYLVVGREALLPISAADVEGEARFELPGSRKRPLPYIGYYDNSFLHPVIQHHLQRQREVPQLETLTENYNSVSVKALVKEGYGIGWIPASLLEDTLSYGKVALAGDENWHIPLELRLYRDKHNQSNNLHQFWQQLKDYLDSKGRL
ncbi:LysR family transcriptional regulator [Marinomonas mediterranea]|jgi:Transcriptional regulator|uniref:Transcriptional regulator, LysR family n=1 Tax=Marinomonas mediterranea (strain ATCC 700492 / JCM 21426 / NBRC 103028 / MMB-1) TaxID=717774 RepID=F2JZX7_MARM1|nr:LysR family transcriptional regulator [Marinomonas mediterranea]ADZ92089.1 transcriptional regulator, LysR family [Marinomonas mediterranea MMB-1]WCN10051.1 LysR family transcriptional regulator [Marinomonas mediterranea]WCN14101.1 LysR family transcriptional regulator [Marinomonas mediterranea]WCN18157.1 LysR family transcriptional regulator [Marinomonas mediterranea MMB-1]